MIVVKLGFVCLVIFVFQRNVVSGFQNQLPCRFIKTNLEMISASRPLGSYEKLLATTEQNTHYLRLSHASAAFFTQSFDPANLKLAVVRLLEKHPILRSGIKLGLNMEMHFFPLERSIVELVDQVITTSKVETKEQQFAVVKETMEIALNKLYLPLDTPQFRLHHIILKSRTQQSTLSAFVFSFNHGIDDQHSVHVIIRDLLSFYRQSQEPITLESLPFPASIEQSIHHGSKLPGIKTVQWAIYQLMISLRKPSLLPVPLERLPSEGRRRFSVNERKTIIRFVKLEQIYMNKMLRIFKEKRKFFPGITITHILSAIILYCTNLIINKNSESANSSLGKQENLLRFLLSVDLRPFYREYEADTVKCASGAVDYLVSISNPITFLLRKSITSSISTCDREEITTAFWHTVAFSSQQAKQIIQEKQWVPESVRLFDIGMNTVNILQAVELDSRNQNTLGRGYSCSVSNMGRVDIGTKQRTERSDIEVDRCYFGTSQHHNGVLCQLSCMTMNETLHGCLQFPFPIITEAMADEVKHFFESLFELLFTSESSPTSS